MSLRRIIRGWAKQSANNQSINNTSTRGRISSYGVCFGTKALACSGCRSLALLNLARGQKPKDEGKNERQRCHGNQKSRKHGSTTRTGLCRHKTLKSEYFSLAFKV